MKYEYRVALSVLVGVAAIVAGAFSMPALTSGGNQGSTGVSQQVYEAAVSRELAFCQAQPQDINCRCFAQKSGTILTHNAPRVQGAVYADQTELARGQAARAC